MIWALGEVKTSVCPVLAFTPQVDSALRWFDVTHEKTKVDGRYHWRRTGLPGPGAVGDQDALLMEAIELLETWHNNEPNG